MPEREKEIDCAAPDLVESPTENAADTQISSNKERSAGRAKSLTGKLIQGRLELLEPLGEGGMSSVYKGFDRTLKRFVAIKVLLPGLAHKDHILMRFQQEARAASKLNHQNIVKVLEFGTTEEGAPYLIMDLVEGQSLAEMIREKSALDVETTLKILKSTLKALKHAHENRVVHRDVKPSNIMLARDQKDDLEVKIVDFGIAKILSQEGDESQGLTQTGEVFGSPLYMSPEQGNGKKLDHRSDIYSLGCVLFECLTGLPPFLGQTSLQTLVMHQSSPPLTLKEATMGLDFPDELEKIVGKMLAKSPERRYQSVSELEDDLDQFQAGSIDLAKFDRIHLPADALNKRQDLSEFFRIANQANLQKIELKAMQGPLNPHRQDRDSTLLIVIAVTALFVFILVSILALAPIFTRSAGNKRATSSSLAQPKQMPPDVRPRSPDEFYVTDGYLDLSNTHLSPTEWSRLRTVRGVRILNLNGSNISDAELSYSLTLPLQELELARCHRLTNRGVQQLSALKSLENLSLEGNRQLGDECLTSPPLQVLRLNLSGTGITGRGLEKLSHLPRLRTLDISDLGKLDFKSMPPVFELIIGSNSLTSANASILSSIRPALLTVMYSGPLTTDEFNALCSIKRLNKLDVTKLTMTLDQYQQLVSTMPRTVVKAPDKMLSRLKQQ